MLFIHFKNYFLYKPIWLNRIFLILLFITPSPNTGAYMHKICAPTETASLSEIKTALLNIKMNNDESNQSRVAFIIASAIANKFHKPVDQSEITRLLNQKTLFRNTVSLLEIKQVINELGYSANAIETNNSQALQNLSHEVLITMDNQHNFISLVNTSESTVYFIYGKFSNDVIVCPIQKKLFLNNFTNHKFLILQ